MWKTIAVLVGLRTPDLADAGPKSEVLEPDFQPFDLSRFRATEAGQPAALGASTTREARTLRELGVPGPLAAEMELVFGFMGLVDGDRIVGVSFRTPEGATFALRTRAAAGDLSANLAA